ncbi:uncharacterized protein EI90DRAFT_3014100 [Cantharellus anzutake]|uniref:uncharacterized protein n=1 Tax=Cantharellus anzutake TaxID=1750568 RepID=UPI0019033429|nr:uncharacterized protein EI90DRAFT_3014100 [Cantharellus anzutake]KAF8336305.1 hypothetical protein EI90DRAFT_3014100 [Cantharellus anzutake]
MPKFLNKLKEKFPKKGATSMPVLGPSSPEPAPMPAPRPSSTVLRTPAPAPAAVAAPEVAVAPSSDTGFRTVWNGILGMLHIAQASLGSVPVPGLKTAIGVSLEIVRQLDVGSVTAALGT